MRAPREHFIDVAGGACRVWEKGEGPRLGVLFGLRGCPRWTPFLDRLAECHTVVVPSLPGFSGSDPHHRLLDGHLDWVSATTELIQGAGLRGGDIMANSVAGMLCADAAAIAPGLVGRLVLGGSYGLFEADDPMGDVFALVPEEANRRMVFDAARYAAAFEPTDADDWQAWKLDQFRADEAAARIIWPLGDRGLGKRLRRLDQAVLIVWGGDDRLAPASYAERFAEAIGVNARTAIIPGAGHHMWLDRPDETAAAVLEFLRSEPAVERDLQKSDKRQRRTPAVT